MFLQFSCKSTKRIYIGVFFLETFLSEKKYNKIISDFVGVILKGKLEKILSSFDPCC